MSVIRHNPDGVFPPYRCYSHATEITLEIEAMAAK